MLNLFNPSQSSTYHPTGDYISFDFVYKPEELLNDLRGGSYGDVADWGSPDTYHNYASKFSCEEVAGVFVYGTPAGIDKLKLSIEPLLQYGFWDDIITATQTVVAQPFSNVMGCGQCPGSVIWVSPEQGVLEACDTIYHEYLHNAGWTADEEEHAWIYRQAGKVRAYLSSFV